MSDVIQGPMTLAPGAKRSTINTNKSLRYAMASREGCIPTGPQFEAEVFASLVPVAAIVQAEGSLAGE